VYIEPNIKPTNISPYINNPLFTYYILFISSLLSHFVEKKYFHGNMGTYKIGGAPPGHKALGFSSPLLAVAGWMIGRPVLSLCKQLPGKKTSKLLHILDEISDHLSPNCLL
jgi:hypothetical protein